MKRLQEKVFFEERFIPFGKESFYFILGVKKNCFRRLFVNKRENKCLQSNSQIPSHT